MFALLAVVLLSFPGVAQGQGEADNTRQTAWRVLVDGEEAPELAPQDYDADSLRAAAGRVVRRLQEDGYYLARIDSARHDERRNPPQTTLYVRRGPKITVGSIHFEGVHSVSEEALRRRMHTRPGRALVPEELEEDIARLLEVYEAEGYPLAQISVAEVALQREDGSALEVTLRVEEGAALRLQEVALPEGLRTSARFVRQVTGLHSSPTLDAYDPERVQQRLEATGLYREVGRPSLRWTEGEGAVLFIPLEEEPPGTFDLALGYLPNEGEGGGQVVGSGHLMLRNLFGGGRELALQIDQRPGQVSSVDAMASDPFLFGTPFGLELRFEGLQQDSTYGKQRYRAGASYRLASGLRIAGTLSREVTQPGQAGARLAGEHQRVSRSQALMAGIDLRYRRVDHPLNPRHGLLVESRYERGRQHRRFRRVTAEQDTTWQQSTESQERLQATVRTFVPTWFRQVAVLGLDASLTLSDTYDRSDLLRMGGARSLRGYDEDQFLGWMAARALAEYRYQLAREAYAFTFVDLGHVRTPALDERDPREGWYPGYGFGLQFRTALGLASLSYAMNDKDGMLNGRIHLRLSVGL